MRAKNYKIFIKEVANKLNVSEELVSDLVLFYYNKLRENLSELTHPKINVTGLGTFNMIKNKVETSIAKKKNYDKSLEKETYDGYEKHLSVKEQLGKLEKALDMINKLNDKKNEFKKNKNESSKSN